MKRDYPERPIVGVGGVVVDGDRALIVRRATEPLKGEWSIPGGVVELGEKLREATAREVLEETGLVVEAGEVLDVFDSIFADPDGSTQYHFVLIDFLCRPVSGTLQAATDVSEVKWIILEDLATLTIREITANVIRKGLGSAGNKKPV
ncbi:MAG TPA: NUDIX hydrolase [Clostridia bacterium]|nr:NUDIX hydrolase [Clostridia bacterium]